jgi:hypothetical protein
MIVAPMLITIDRAANGFISSSCENLFSYSHAESDSQGEIVIAET